MTPWEELGLAPTGEAGLIRKAYAAKLKRTRPEDDPAGFTRLRAAYETALTLAPRIAASAPAPPKPPVPADLAPDQTPAPAPEVPDRISATAKPINRVEAVADRDDAEPDRQTRPGEPKPVIRVEAAADAEEDRDAQPLEAVNPASPVAVPPRGRPQPASERPAYDLLPAELRTAILGVEDALNRREVEAAVRRLEAARAGHLLPLRVEFGLKERLAALLLAEPALPTQRLIEIATLFGWYDAKSMISHRNGSVEARLCARIDMEMAAEVARRAEAAEKAAPAPKPKSTASGLRLVWFALVVLGVFARGLSSCDTSVKAPYTLHAPNPQPATPAVPLALGEGQHPEPVPGSAELAYSAAEGSARAQAVLGLAYLAGDKVPRDPEVAAQWLRKSADQGDAEGLWALGYLYTTGLGVPRDPAEAQRLLLRSAQMRYPRAGYLLALTLIDGDAGPADPKTGFTWMKQAALLGFLPAMKQLGDFYANGTGTAQDLVKSAAWRRAAAAAGERTAMYAYGLMALRGIGMPVDVEEGYRWLMLASHAARDRTMLAEAHGGVANSVLARQEAQDASAAAAAKAALDKISPKLLAPARRAAIDQTLKTWHATPPTPPAIDVQ